MQNRMVSGPEIYPINITCMYENVDPTVYYPQIVIAGLKDTTLTLNLLFEYPGLPNL